MKKSSTMKFFVIVVLVFFILSTGLMFVLYLASPSTVLELEDQDTITTGETAAINTQTGDINPEDYIMADGLEE